MDKAASEVEEATILKVNKHHCDGVQVVGAVQVNNNGN